MANASSAISGLGKLRFFKRHSATLVPRKATPFSAGYDIFFSRDHELKPGLNAINCEFGLKLPINSWALLKIRSSSAAKNLTLEAGVIDEDFDPETDLFLLLRNYNAFNIKVKRGQSAAQLIVNPRHEHDFEVVEGPPNPKSLEVDGSKHEGLGSTGNVIDGETAFDMKDEPKMYPYKV